MKCEKCNGRGFTELEHGLVMIKCQECEGTGEEALTEGIGKPSITLGTEYSSIPGYIKTDEKPVIPRPRKPHRQKASKK